MSSLLDIIEEQTKIFNEGKNKLNELLKAKKILDKKINDSLNGKRRIQTANNVSKLLYLYSVFKIEFKDEIFENTQRVFNFIDNEQLPEQIRIKIHPRSVKNGVNAFYLHPEEVVVFIAAISNYRLYVSENEIIDRFQDPHPYMTECEECIICRADIRKADLVIRTGCKCVYNACHDCLIQTKKCIICRKPDYANYIQYKYKLTGKTSKVKKQISMDSNNDTNNINDTNNDINNINDTNNINDINDTITNSLT